MINDTQLKIKLISYLSCIVLSFSSSYLRCHQSIHIVSCNLIQISGCSKIILRSLMQSSLMSFSMNINILRILVERVSCFSNSFAVIKSYNILFYSLKLIKILIINTPGIPLYSSKWLVNNASFLGVSSFLGRGVVPYGISFFGEPPKAVFYKVSILSIASCNNLSDSWALCSNSIFY